MFKAIGFALFASLVACASPTPSSSYTLMLDDSLSETTKEQVVEAVSSWEEILDHKLTVKIVSQACGMPSGLQGAIDYGIGSDPRIICVTASTAAKVNSLAGAAPSAPIAGFTLRLSDIDSATTYLPMDRDANVEPYLMVEIIAHELGHAMGLEHTQSGTLMCWETTCAASRPGCDDVSQWHTVRGTSDITSSCPKGGNYTLEH